MVKFPTNYLMTGKFLLGHNGYVTSRERKISSLTQRAPESREIFKTNEKFRFVQSSVGPTPNLTQYKKFPKIKNIFEIKWIKKVMSG